MNKDKLLGIIKGKGLTVYEVIAGVEKQGVSMSSSTFYKGLNDKRPFKANEILALANVLNLDKEEVLDIFFAELVS